MLYARLTLMNNSVKTTLMMINKYAYRVIYVF